MSWRGRQRRIKSPHMIRFVRYSIAASLVALITLMGLSLASERGVSRIAGQIILCTGDGHIAVWVDADGQPVDRTALCPDQTLTLLGALDIPAPQTGFQPLATAFIASFANSRFATATAVEPRGRSPPVPV